MSVIGMQHVPLDIQRRDLLGGFISGVLGGDDTKTQTDPLASIAGPLTSALSPVVSPIVPSISPTMTLTSPTISFSPTSAQSSSSSTSSSSTSSSSSSTSSSTASTTATSNSASTSTSTSTSATTDDTATSNSSPLSTGTLLSQTTTSTSASGSPTLASNSAPKSFLQNKALSVGVITGASLVGLVIIVFFVTWVVRKRRNRILDQEVLDFSTEALVTHHGDPENGSRTGSSSGGSGLGGYTSTGASSSSHGRAFSAHGNRTGTAMHGPAPGREMYETSGYPTLPVFVPAQSQPNPIKPYNDQALAYAGYIPNPYDQAYAGIEMPVPPDAAAEKPFQRRRSTHRKQPPSYPELNIIVPYRPVYSSPSPLSAISLSNSPLKPSSGVNPANPIEQPIPSPASGDRSARRSLTKPISPVTERAAKRTSARSHVHELDPSAPQMPVSLPLPDAFGGSVTDEKAPMRRFMVRNE